MPVYEIKTGFVSLRFKQFTNTMFPAQLGCQSLPICLTFSGLKRQFNKAVTECKTQATNAKKLMKSIEAKKWQIKRKTYEEALDDDDENVSWGSDFDSDEDSDDDNENYQFNSGDEDETDVADESHCGSYNFHEDNNSLVRTKLEGIMATGYTPYDSEPLYETPSTAASGRGSDTSCASSSLSFDSTVPSSSHSEPNYEVLDFHNKAKPNKFVSVDTNSNSSYRREKESHCGSEASSVCSSSLGSSGRSSNNSDGSFDGRVSTSPKTSLRVIPRPPNKPVVPPKPNFYKVRPLNNNQSGSTTSITTSSSTKTIYASTIVAPISATNQTNQQSTKRTPRKKIVRPSNEPPPPPLPKCPPPMVSQRLVLSGPLGELTLDDLNRVLQENDESDDYEPPITVSSTKNSKDFEVTSSQKMHFPVHLNIKTTTASDSDSGSGSIGLPFPVSPPPGFDDNDDENDNYEPMIVSGSTPNLAGENEANYEVVNERDEDYARRMFLGSTISLSTAEELSRPKLPRAKQTLSHIHHTNHSHGNHSSHNHHVGSLSLKLPEKLKSLPELFMKSDRSNSNLTDMQDSSSSSPSFKISNHPAHRPLPAVPQADIKPSSGKSYCFPNFSEILHNFEWFHNIERDEASRLLESLNTEGGYLVRSSKRAGRCNPFTLTIFHDRKVFHLNIRQRPDRLFALGKQKEREKTFQSVPDLIAYHQREPILLTTRGQPAGMTRLVITPSH